MSRLPWLCGAVCAALVACSPGGGGTEPGSAESLPSAGSGQTEVEAGVIGDGRALFAASSDGSAFVVATTIGADVIDHHGQMQKIPTNLPLPLSHVKASADGRYAMLFADSAAEVWMVDSVPTLMSELDGITDASFTGDSTTVVATYPHEVRSYPVLRPATATVLFEAPAGASFASGASIAAAGTLIAAPVSGVEADVTTFIGTSAAELSLFADAAWTVRRVQVAAPGDRVVLEVNPGDDFETVLSNLTIGQPVPDWETEAGAIPPRSVWALGGDGRVLVADGTMLRAIGANGATAAETPLDGLHDAVAIAATSFGYTVALADGSLLFADPDAELLARIEPATGPLSDVQTLANGAGTVTVDRDGTVRSWSGDGTVTNESTLFRASSVNDVDLSSDGALIAFGTADGIAHVTSSIAPTPPVALVHPEGSIDSIAFSTDDSRLLTGVGKRISDVAFDDTISLWNLGTNERFFEAGGEGEDVNGCANFRNVVEFSPVGDVFAASSHDFTVSLRDAASGELIHEFPPHTSSVLDFAFSPQGDRLVTSSDDGSVRVWDANTFELSSEFVAPPGGYWSLAVMPDGDTLVVSDLTGAVSIVDIRTGNRVLAFNSLKSRTGELALSPDGSMVAAGSDSNHVLVWSTATGQVLMDLAGHASPVTSAAFSSNGQALVTGSQDATVRIWTLV
ncbi:MAG: WD40 repeat domain-containing protein [Rhodococcus fascians]